jgi:2-dehydropantoate 2-reductase
MTNQTRSRVAAVGAGAIGCYYGAVLARAGIDVTLIGRYPHVDAIKRDGLLFQSPGHRQYIPIKATHDIAAVGDARWVLFCVKSLDTDAAARAMAPHLAHDAVVLSLQNGVNNAERIRAHVRQPVFPVLVYAAAQMSGPGSVRHTGGGSVVIGELKALRRGEGSDDVLLKEAAALFASAEIPVTISEDVEAELWSKLVMNCAYNAISALGEARYGDMVAMPEVHRIMSDVIDEVVAVANAKGVRLPDDIAAATFSLADAMALTISSTAQDIMRGKRTEIDHLNGYVVREGEALGIATPVNRTLAGMMRLLERTKPPSG